MHDFTLFHEILSFFERNENKRFNKLLIFLINETFTFLRRETENEKKKQSTYEDQEVK